MSARNDKPMTDADLDIIEARANAATKGPLIAVQPRSQDGGKALAHFGPTWADNFPARTSVRMEAWSHDPVDWAQHERNAVFFAHAREDILSSLADNRRLRAEIAAWRSVTGADSPEALDAEAKAIRARARGEPTRGHLVCAVNDAGHDRVEAEHARDAAAAQHRQSPTAERTQALAAAEQRLTAAKEDERAARADLAAFEREHGLTVTCREQVRS